MKIECPSCGCENAEYKIVDVSDVGYVWEAICSECGWEDTRYEF